MTDHRDRLRRNAESKQRAEHDREPWSSDEVDFLMAEFPDANGKPDDELALAELLGRTVEACRQRFYEVRRGSTKIVSVKTTTTTHYIGISDDPDDQWWSPDYYTDK